MIGRLRRMWLRTQSQAVPMSRLDRDEAEDHLLDSPTAPSLPSRRRLFAARNLAAAGLIVLLLLLAHTYTGREIGHRLELLHDDSCFVSVVRAYEQDLARHTSKWNVALPGHHGRNERDHAGHIVVGGDDAPHPIVGLLARGEDHYLGMVSRQSTTAAEARAEYRRRYSREPPAHFDQWFQFAQERNVVLLDEYDNIEEILAPFRALSRSARMERMKAALEIPQSFAFHVRNGQVSRTRNDGAPEWAVNWRGPDLEKIMNPFIGLLPDIDIPISSFDEPMIYSSWKARHDPDHVMVPPADDNDPIDLHEICSPESNANTHPKDETRSTFVENALDAGDACKNPYLLDSHGIFLQPHTPQASPRSYKELYPMFGLSPHTLSTDLKFTPMDQFSSNKGKDPAWSRKPDSRLAWRGSTTGMPNWNENVPWKKSHRFRLHLFANNESTAETTIVAPAVGSDVGVTEEQTTVEAANKHFFDMGLAGDPIQCAEGFDEVIKKDITFFPHQGQDELNTHKFLFDIDGNAWSGRFRRLMSTNSLVIKTTVFPGWFQPKLVDWFMYVPARMDFSDLYGILAFFRGTPKNPKVAFDTTANAIAVNGKCFVEKMFRLEDIETFMFRMLIEYAELFHLEE